MPKLATDSKTTDISFNDFKNEIVFTSLFPYFLEKNYFIN